MEKHSSSEETSAPQEKKSFVSGFLLPCLKVAGMAFVFGAILKFVTPINVVVGQSMEPTYYEGDIVISLAVGKSYKQGNIVVLNGQNALEGRQIIKRIAAIPGDKVDMDSTTGVIRVNDVIVVDEQTASVPDEGLLSFPLIVPDGYVFVLGDNPSHSTDSRCQSLGMVAMENIIGVVKVKIPLSVFSKS